MVERTNGDARAVAAGVVKLERQPRASHAFADPHAQTRLAGQVDPDQGLDVTGAEAGQDAAEVADGVDPALRAGAGRHGHEIGAAPDG